MQQARERHERRDWIIILLILLIGFTCIVFAGGEALRLSPSWSLNTNMESYLNPNSVFKPGTLFEPVDPSILTKPAWMNVFLTPGASANTRTPAPTQPPVNTSVATTPTQKTPATPSPTNTFVPPTSTRTSVFVPPTVTVPPLTATAQPQADLRITKTDGRTTYSAYTGNNTVIYTIVVSNNGPSNVNGVVVTDIKPAQVTTWNWTCTQSGGATGCTPMLGNGNFNDTVNLPNGGRIKYTVTTNIAIGSSGNLVNTAVVSLPSGYGDPNNANNSDTDTDTYAPAADLAITKTDGSGTYPVGGNVTYTITVTNNGPDDVIGATISDTKPAQITAWGWCVAPCVPVTAITPVLTDTINLTVGSSITYTVFANIDPAATGNLSNTATVTNSITETVPGNNSATDTDTPVLNVNLGITKDDGVGSYTPGTSTTYTIVVTNAGPADAIGITVIDTFLLSSQITGASWTCVPAGGATCTAGPVFANINDAVNIPVGGSVIYSATVSISPSATGPLSNTATLTIPGGYVNTGNNSATDTDNYAPQVNLSIAKTDGHTHYIANAIKTYTVIVSNTGPSDLTGATVTDATLTNVTNTNLAVDANWTCAGAGGGTCTANGSGNINDTVNLPAGSSVTYTITATVSAAPAGDLVNTATVTAPGGYTGTTSDSDTDTDTLIVSSGTSVGNLGTTPNGNPVQNVPSGTPLILDLSSAITWEHPGNDITYYEEAQVPGILMDQVILEISDGSNWYPILNWGDGNPNPGTNIVSPPGCATEIDDCSIDSTVVPLVDYLGNGIFTGITIDIDSILTGIPPGTQFRYIRITTLPGGDGTTGIDAIYVWP